MISIVNQYFCYQKQAPIVPLSVHRFTVLPMIAARSPAYWRVTSALCLGSFMVFNNLYITQPLLPMLAEHFQISELLASYSLTLCTLTLGVALLVYAPLSDALGRRALLLGSMLGATVCALLISQIDDYHWLLALRAIQGVMLAGLPAVALAYMADEFEPDALLSAVGLYIAANSLGGISGRLIGGFVGEYLGWQEAFLLMGIFGFVLWLVVLWLLPVQQRFQSQPLAMSRITRQFGQHLRNRWLLPAFLVGGLNFFVFINQFSFITFVLEDAPYHLSSQFLGMLFLTYLSGTLASGLSGKFTRRWGQPVCMTIGCGLLILGSLVTLFDSLVVKILGLLINSFGFFFAHSSASGYVSQTAKHAKASASALYLLTYYLGASTGGLYLNLFWMWNHWTGVILGSLLVLGLTLSLSLWLAHQRQRLIVQPTPNLTQRVQTA